MIVLEQRKTVVLVQFVLVQSGLALNSCEDPCFEVLLERGSAREKLEASPQSFAT